MFKPDFKKLPTLPGVYFFKDKNGHLIYIGKAKNLRLRLASYWAKGNELEPAKQEMVRQIQDLDYTLVDNETEALLLEAGLIKKHLPDFNIVLRDDKNWSYLVLTTEDFPKLVFVHGRKKIRGKYFGPYTSALAARTMLKLLHRLLPLRTCRKDIKTYPAGKVCVEYHLTRSPKPCSQLMTKTDYRQVIKQTEAILNGGGQEIYQQLKDQMANAAKKQNYELAARLRDRLWAWEKIRQPQNVVFDSSQNQDVVGLLTLGQQAVLTIMQIRQGQILDKINYLLSRRLEQTAADIIETALVQHYQPPMFLPQEIWLSLKASSTLKQALRPARLSQPSRGRKKKMLQLADKNAWSYYQRLNRHEPLPKVLYDLQQLLNLPRLPVRIETYDISNIQGNWNVGSLVVFDRGLKKPSAYKKFRIKTVSGANDVRAMKEMLERRQKHSDWGEPDLIVLDGGKPQLNTVYPILKPSWQPKIIALAKKEEEIFRPHQSASLKLPRSHPVSLLLQRTRNEAHRTAIGYYRLLHKKSLK